MTFEPFQRVLVRDEDVDYWGIDFFEQYAETLERPYVCLTNSYKQCLPYNDETGHLLGTFDSPTEPEFKFGDKVEVSNNGIDWYKAIYFHKTDVSDLFPHVVMRDNGRRHELFEHCRKADW